jgi:3-deoxy-7-phosphoheptulonate synthase
VSDIIEEARSFFAIAASEGVHPGGAHLEMTGSDVTECIGGTSKLAREDLGRNYLTHCDPRLNRAQALDVGRAIAGLLPGRVSPAARAA